MKQHNLDPKFKSVYTKDSVKVTDIFDAFQKLRYRVTLTSYDIFNDLYGVIYEVEVVNCFTAPEPLIIVSRPADNEDPIVDYGQAMELFNQYVEHYKSLVKAETRDYQDVEVFKDKIGYEETMPRCCETCKWVKHMTPDKHHMHFGMAVKLQCENPATQLEYDFQNPPNAFKPFTPDRCYTKPSEVYKLVVQPNVKMFGVCKHYEKNPNYEDECNSRSGFKVDMPRPLYR